MRAPERAADGLLPARHAAARRRAAGRDRARARHQPQPRRLHDRAGRGADRPRLHEGRRQGRRRRRRRARPRRPLPRRRRPGAAGAGRPRRARPAGAGGCARPLLASTAGGCCGRSACTAPPSAASWRWRWTPSPAPPLPAQSELGADGGRPRDDEPHHRRPTRWRCCARRCRARIRTIARPGHRPAGSHRHHRRDRGRPPAAGDRQGHRVPAAGGRARDEQRDRAAARSTSATGSPCAPSRCSR